MNINKKEEYEIGKKCEVCGEKHNFYYGIGGEIPQCSICGAIHYPPCFTEKRIKEGKSTPFPA